MRKKKKSTYTKRRPSYSPKGGKRVPVKVRAHTKTDGTEVNDYERLGKTVYPKEELQKTHSSREDYARKQDEARQGKEVSHADWLRDPGSGDLPGIDDKNSNPKEVLSSKAQKIVARDEKNRKLAQKIFDLVVKKNVIDDSNFLQIRSSKVEPRKELDRTIQSIIGSKKPVSLLNLSIPAKEKLKALLIKLQESLISSLVSSSPRFQKKVDSGVYDEFIAKKQKEQAELVAEIQLLFEQKKELKKQQVDTAQPETKTKPREKRTIRVKKFSTET